MKISKNKKKVPKKSKNENRLSNKPKFSLKISLKKIIKEREKLLKKQDKISQEYCFKCSYSTICYNKLERKEFNRLHKDHKLGFRKEMRLWILRNWGLLRLRLLGQ